MYITIQNSMHVGNLFHTIKIKMPKFRFAIKITIEIFKAITNLKHTTLRFIKTVRLCVNWFIKHNLRFGVKSWK